MTLYPQKLPTYKHDFESALWKSKKTKHYIFYYMLGTSADHDIEYIAETQEQAFEKIVRFLELLPEQLPKQIEYYLYPSKETKENLMGDSWHAQAICNEMRIHVLYTDKIKPIGPHEDTHLLSLPLGFPINFFQEGLAEYMVGHDWFGNKFEDTVKELKKTGKLPSLDSMFDANAWFELDDEYARHYYSWAALVTQYLIDTFGKEVYFEFYEKINRENTSMQNRKIFKDIFGIKPSDVILPI